MAERERAREYQRYEEGVFEAQASGDGEYRLQAAQQSSKQDHLPDVGLHGQAGQVEAERRQLLIAVQSVLTANRQSFQSSHERPSPERKNSPTTSTSSVLLKPPPSPVPHQVHEVSNRQLDSLFRGRVKGPAQERGDPSQIQDLHSTAQTHSQILHLYLDKLSNVNHRHLK